MPSIREKKAIASKMELIKTIAKVLKEDGYTKLSINYVSELSGVDKAFIYRHYNGFDGLLEAYVEKQDYWLRNLISLTEEPIEDHKKFMKKILLEQFQEIYKNEELQQFLIWELGDKSGFTTKIAIEREILAESIFKQSRDVFMKFRIDMNMLYAILSASIYYLVLHKDKSTFCEYDFTQQQDINEFTKTLEWLIDVLFEKIETENKLEQVAIKAYRKGISVRDIVEITGLSLNKVNTLIHTSDKKTTN